MRPRMIVMSLEELENEARALMRSLTPAVDHATLITLSGELGAGKTAFTQAVARSLGVEEAVTSPTFVLAKSYNLPEGNAFRRLVHIDAYRLTHGKELAALDFTHTMEHPDTLVVLEWPERVRDTLPEADVAIRLEIQSDETRTLTYV